MSETETPKTRCADFPPLNTCCELRIPTILRSNYCSLRAGAEMNPEVVTAEQEQSLVHGYSTEATPTHLSTTAFH